MSILLLHNKDDVQTSNVAFLNQACCSQHVTGFFVQEVSMCVNLHLCVCVCVSTSKAINNLRCDMDHILLVKHKLYSFCMGVVFSIISSHGLSIDVNCKNQLTKSKISLIN